MPKRVLLVLLLQRLAMAILVLISVFGALLGARSDGGTFATEVGAVQLVATSMVLTLLLACSEMTVKRRWRRRSNGDDGAKGGRRVL